MEGGTWEIGPIFRCMWTMPLAYSHMEEDDEGEGVVPVSPTVEAQVLYFLAQHYMGVPVPPSLVTSGR